MTGTIATLSAQPLVTFVAADAASSRRVYALIIALAVLGLAFAGIAWWLLRQTRVDPELLAPLERMSERSWLKHDPAERHRLLDEVRPPGAEPLTRARGLPNVDPELAREGPPQRSLDDLADLGLRRTGGPLAAEGVARPVPPPPPGLAPPPPARPLPPPSGRPSVDGATAPTTSDAVELDRA